MLERVPSATAAARRAYVVPGNPANTANNFLDAYLGWSATMLERVPSATAAARRAYVVPGNPANTANNFLDAYLGWADERRASLSSS